MSDSDRPKLPTNRIRFSLREMFGLLTISVLVVALMTTIFRLQASQTELTRLRDEAGYLGSTPRDHIAAAVLPSAEPLTYRVRIRIPESSTPYRLAYSTVWPAGQSGPVWFAAIPAPQGESMVTVRIAEDPRDERWKVSALLATAARTKRMATGLRSDQVEVFRGSHQIFRQGIPRGKTTSVPADQVLRVLDERWLVGENGLLLYGDRPPESDQIGIYAELQPDIGPL